MVGDKSVSGLASRLKAEVEGRATQAEIAAEAGVSEKTISRWLNGQGSPSPDALDRIIRRWSLNAAYIYGLSGESGDWATNLPSVESDPNMVSVALKDWVAVSAGNGNLATDVRQTERFIGFRGDWLRRNFGSVGGLAAFVVQGDSMIPELSDGDIVMVNECEKDGPDGLYVLRVGELVFVKRLQRVGRTRYRLLSTNAAYMPVDIDLAVEGEGGFDIIGRVVWAAKKVS